MTLANRLLMLAALIVVVTTVLLMATSAAGVYQMATEQEAVREISSRDIVVAELSGRLDGAYGVTRTTAERTVLVADDPQAWRRALMDSVVANAQYLEGLALVDRTGKVLAAWPADVTEDGLPTADALQDASATVLPFAWERPEGEDRGTLWAIVPVRGRPSPDRLLIGRLRTDFIERVLAGTSASEHVVLAIVLDSHDRPVYEGGDAKVLSGAAFAFTPDKDSPTSGFVSIETTQSYSGYYADITVPAGLGWRVAAVEPAAHVFTETWQALRPAVFGWIIAVVLALSGSLVVVNRVTQPIARLGRRARLLAAGAEIAPESVSQNDEFGGLLEAFDSIALRVSRLSDIAELLARSSDRSLVLEGVTSSIIHMLGPVDVEVLLLGEADRLDVVAVEGALAGAEGLQIPLADVPWVAESISTGEPVVSAGDGRDPLLAFHGAGGAVAALSVPLWAGSDIIGAVVVVRSGAGAFSESESETVRSFAAQASVALQNARLFEEERTSRREAEALRAIAERAASPWRIAATLDSIGRMTADLLGLTEFTFALRNRAAYGLPSEGDEDPGLSWLALFDALSEDGHSGTDPLFVAEDSDPRAADLLGRHGARNALIAPLLHEDAVIGLLVVLSAEAVSPPGARRLSLVVTAAAQAALALRNAYLFDQARSRADNLETIFRISHAVGSSLESRVVLNRVLDVVQKILAADAVMLMTYDAQRKVITAPMARGILHRDMLEATYRPGEDVPGRVFETREPERFDHIAGAGTRLLDAAASEGLQSLLVVPLLARGRSVGVLAAFARTPAAFSTEELELLRTFASQAALAIDTADMFSREHEVANVLKESIQPTRLPRVAGIDVSQVYLPAGAEADIGGDYYDLFAAPDGRVVAAIGDVCGKGVLAATKTSMIKYAVRGMVAAELAPSRIARELNRMLTETGDPSNIVTLWLGYLDLEKKTIVYANAGHPPGLLLRGTDRSIERLGTTGALLGAVPNADWSERTVEVGPGDTVLLYTDGVTEARTGSRFFGEGRVRRSLRKGGSAEAIARRLFAQVQRFAAGELRDDAAILTVVISGAEASVEHVSPAGVRGK